MTSIDTNPNSPGPLAVRLRELRKDVGLSGMGLATRLGWQQSKVSRIENGRQIASEGDVTAWVDACGGTDALADQLLVLLADDVAARHEWHLRAKAGQELIQRDYHELGLAASVIRNAENTWVPGLLQTADYARARIIENAEVWETGQDHVDRDVLARMQRQQIMYDPAKRFEFVITEAVLRLVLCEPAAMRAQLDRLISVSSLPNVKLGVIPHGVRLKKSPAHAFILFDDLAVVEIASGELKFPGDGRAARYQREMDLLVKESVFGDDARRLIMAAMEALAARSD